MLHVVLTPYHCDFLFRSVDLWVVRAEGLPCDSSAYPYVKLLCGDHPPRETTGPTSRLRPPVPCAPPQDSMHEVAPPYLPPLPTPPLPPPLPPFSAGNP